MVLKALYEPLINKLMQCRPEDIISIVGFEAYKADPALTCEGIRSNFYQIGLSLRNMLEARAPRINDDPPSDERAGKKAGRLDEERPAEPLKYFYAAGMPGKYEASDVITGRVEYDDLLFQKWRQRIFEGLLAIRGLKDLQTYETSLIQRNIEDALELQNPICQYQLRDVVYIHNQIVRNAEHIYCKGYEGARQRRMDGQAANEILEEGSDEGDDKAGDSGSDAGSSADEGGDDICPVKQIMHLLGNQYIILEVIDKNTNEQLRFITQD
jgi:hypothetical protein